MNVSEVDVLNRYGVALSSRGIVLLMPPQHPMNNTEALVLAAWLVAMARDDAGAFDAILEKVMST